ncbi:tetratricopeptide repeat protein [Bryocella elongata]|nr:tetratricopeptide repeat protein [Bryocella elongata]
MRFAVSSLAAGSLLSLSLALPAQTPSAQAPATLSNQQKPQPASSSSSDDPTLPPGQQQGTSSSSGPGERASDQTNPVARPRAAQIQPGSSSVTLETNEPLFDMAVALNVCGYDQGLDQSMPVRAKIRAELNKALEESEAARTSRDAVCQYIQQHRQNDSGLNVGQYVSLALYLSPPPELTPNADETQLPPQAASVINILPKLRQFAEDIDLHLIWIRHRPEYEALIARVHDPMAQMVLDTNIYLHQPVSTYDGRRFLVLLEPMLAPEITNARIYGTDYIVQMSPDNSAGDPVRMDEIRHIYLHYTVEPMVYSRGSAMERIQPILRGVQDAPLEFFYKSDAPALLTECLIKGIEAHLYVVPGPRPVKPRTIHERSDMDVYEAEKTAWDKANDLARLKLIDVDEAQGWVLTEYFYNQLTSMSRIGDGLRDEIAPMIYGMDVQRELHHAEQVLFVKTVPPDPLRPSMPQARQLTAMDRAEILLMQGHDGDAADLADKAMADPKGDHAHAQYVLARVELMQGHPDEALEGFTRTLDLSKASAAPDPRTVAWAHIYLGRLYDSESTPERAKAVAEYKAALASRDSRPDTKAAAEAGIARPYKLPQRAQKSSSDDDDDKDFDPTGKKEKDSYQPDPPPSKPPVGTPPN